MQYERSSLALAACERTSSSRYASGDRRREISFSISRISRSLHATALVRGVTALAGLGVRGRIGPGVGRLWSRVESARAICQLRRLIYPLGDPQAECESRVTGVVPET